MYQPAHSPSFISCSASFSRRYTPSWNGLIQAWPYALLILVFISSGLIGHDPWKADEAYIFGVVHEMLRSSDWVVPTLAGEPFMEKPPLFYWVASTSASLFSGWLPLHDGARLASGFFMLLTCGSTACAARIWWGAGTGRFAVLALIACLGTLVQSHLMMPDIPLLTGFALSALGFATILKKSMLGGLWVGIGVGIGFLSKGLIGPAVIGVTSLLLPLFFKQWRTSAYWSGLVTAGLIAIPPCVIWPIALYMRSPILFMDWFWINNVGRFLGFSVSQLGAEHLPWFWSQTIPWFTFPSLPIALWVLWRKRLMVRSEPAIQYSMVSFVVLMTVLAVSSSGRCVYAWPLMIPIAILAAPGARNLPRKLDRLFASSSLVLFGMLSLSIWIAWIAMMLNGAPPDWPRLLRVLPVAFIPSFHATSMSIAAILTIGAVALLRKLWARPGRGLTSWVIGLTSTWALLTTLWMPWLDFAKSYRSVFASMPIPTDVNCIASMNLGEGERAMLRYVTNYSPVRVEVSPIAECTVLLVQQEVALGDPAIDSTRWKEIWRGARPGATHERFSLFQLENR